MLSRKCLNVLKNKFLIFYKIKSNLNCKAINFLVVVYNKRNVHNLSDAWGFVAIAVILALGYVANYNLYENVPKALGNSDLLHNSHSFITERALKDLKILTSFGPRPVGSYANEKLAVDFLKREISFIKQTAHKTQRIAMDVQVGWKIVRKLKFLNS